MGNERNFEQESKSMRYPLQCWVAQNSEQTLSLENELTMPEANSNFSPYTMHGTFSRFKVVLILPPNKDGKRNVIYGNIRHNDEIAYLLEQYEEAKIHRRMYFEKNASQSDTSSPAYSVVFTVGKKLNGKTAAQFLLEGGDPNVLRQSAQFFIKNLKDYPKNQDYIDAIDDALFLQESDNLKESSTIEKSFVLIDDQFKIANGNKRDLRISCVYDNDFPWKIEITNSKVDNAGKIVPNSSIFGSYSLTNMQMAGFINAIKQTLNSYTTNMYPIADAMAKAIVSKVHGGEYNSIEKMVDDLLTTMKPVLIECVKTFSEQ